MDIEKRTYPRFFVQGDMFAALGSELEAVGKIEDISQKGLALSYLCEGIRTGSDRDLSQVCFYLPSNSYHLNKMPCKIVYDIIDPKSDNNYYIMTHRCGIQFGELSKSQSELLEFFLENCTTRPLLL